MNYCVDFVIAKDKVPCTPKVGVSLPLLHLPMLRPMLAAVKHLQLLAVICNILHVTIVDKRWREAVRYSSQVTASA